MMRLLFSLAFSTGKIDVDPLDGYLFDLIRSGEPWP
jgi:hypothetical protein